MIRYCVVFIVCLATLVTDTALAQTKQVALVIGNSTYQHVPKLTNTLNDADDVAAALGRLGFEVERVKDGRFDDMRRALRDFGRKANGAVSRPYAFNSRQAAHRHSNGHRSLRRHVA